jgi:hypothetical protein
MYPEFPDPLANYPLDRRTISCISGWEYDRSNWKETIPTNFNWVCDKSDYATKAFTANSVGNALGTIVLGWAGDK